MFTTLQKYNYNSCSEAAKIKDKDSATWIIIEQVKDQILLIQRELTALPTEWELPDNTIKSGANKKI